MNVADANVSADALLRTDPPTDPRQFLPLSRGERFRVGCWAIARRLLFGWTPQRFNVWRLLLLRCFGARVDSTAFIHSKAIIHFPWNLTVGPNSRVQHKAILECMGPITLGRGVHVSQYAHLVSGTHDYQQRDMRIVCRPIVIEDGVWLAADVFVGAGVTIGMNTIVGARSGVFSDLPPNVIAVGSAAKVVKRRG